MMVKIINGSCIFSTIIVKIVTLLMPFFLAVTLSNSAYGACPSRATATTTANFGTLNVNSVAVGSLISSMTVTAGSKPNILNISGQFYHNITKFTTLSSLGNGIYDTNVPGIGIKVREFPFQILSSGQGMVQPATYTVELYKTAANVQSGVISSGVIATVSCGTPTTNIYNSIILNAVNIVSTACTVNTSSITVPLGNVYSSEFSSTGSTSAATSFVIPINCPDSGVLVKMELDGNTVSGYSTALALSNAGSSGVASGYGVQVLTGSSPVVIGTTTQVATTTSGQVNIPLKARYIKTSAISSSGTANSTATFTLTYQ